MIKKVTTREFHNNSSAIIEAGLPVEITRYGETVAVVSAPKQLSTVLNDFSQDLIDIRGEVAELKKIVLEGNR